MATENLRLSNHLLNPEHWPAIVRNSAHMPLLKEMASFSLEIETADRGTPEIDRTLHRMLRGCCGLAAWLPLPQKGRAPKYTADPWDLRALVQLVPAGMELEIGGKGAEQGSYDKVWFASLFDRANSRRVAHASELEHNSVLFYNSGSFSAAWTPNLALARILLATYLLAVIQVVQGRALPAPAQRADAPVLASA